MKTVEQLNEHLITASQLGHIEVVKYLVQHGANVNARDSYALRWAARYGHIEVVKYLKSKGAREFA